MEIKSKNIKLKAKFSKVGDDILLIITGGDKPHIGACVLTNQTQSKSIAYKFHKDDIALNLMALKLKKHTRKNICIIGGIHVDNITPKQIKQVLKMTKQLTKKIIKKHLICES